MENPFQKRATEFLRDEEAFLAIVSPEPVRHFLGAAGREGVLYDRLVLVRGTPGSGKTTLGRLFEFPTLTALLRNRNAQIHKPLVGALSECGAIRDEKPAVVGCRLAMETDYRDFWEFPYPDELKLSLMTTLIQSRAVLGWMRNLASSGIDLGSVSIVPRLDAEAAAESIGGTAASYVQARAKAVEMALYKVVGALVAPPISDLKEAITAAYRPFDVIDRIRITSAEGEADDYYPLVILDDAHSLHPKQFRGLQHWLARHELRVARWVLTRLDVLHPSEALAAVTEDRSERPELPGITVTREVVEIMLQSGVGDRREQRLAFRRMAKDMANRYLRRMQLFNSRGLHDLTDLLNTDAQALSASKRKELAASATDSRTSLRLPEALSQDLEKRIDSRVAGKKQPDDVRLAMLNILLHRVAKRTGQRGLFEEPSLDTEKPIAVDASVADGARLHLLHKYDRAYYVGMDALCDAGSENAEQFLRLAGVLVDSIAAQVVRGRSPSLDAPTQNRLLRETAGEILNHWNFPECRQIRSLVDNLAARCVRVSLEPNAPLGAGANAYGVPQDEFDSIPDKYPGLARILQYGIAYNVFAFVPRYNCKGREWCLLELGGVVNLHYGLTLKRGGFLEGTADELATIVGDAKP